jgi:hypothetical protein
MWNIWRERNGRIFENQEHSVGRIIELLMGSLYDWATAWNLCSSHSLGEFLESLSFCSYPLMYNLITCVHALCTW